MEPSQETIILDGRSSPILGVFFALAGIGLMAAAGFGFFDDASKGDVFRHIAWNGFLFVLGSLLTQVGRLIGATKGGMRREGQVLQLPGRSLADRPTIPLDQLERLQLIRRLQNQEEDSFVRWEIELRLRSGATFVVGESLSFDEMVVFGRHLSEHLPCPFDENGIFAPPDGNRPPPLPQKVQRKISGDVRTYRFRIHRGWGLSSVLPLMGITSVWLGAVLMAHVYDSPIAGFIVGPPLGLLGLVVLAVCLGKWLSWETIVIDGGTVTHRVQVWGWTLATQTLDEGEFPIKYIRLRPTGARGTSLEIIGESKTILAANGTTCSSQDLNSQDLMIISAWFNEDLRRTQVSGNADPIPE